jgi:hypothetical protein
MRTRARAVYIVEYGQKSSGPANRLRSQTKTIPIFPVEVSYKEPNPDLVIPPRKAVYRKKRKSTRPNGENPRAKGTNPKAKAKP